MKKIIPLLLVLVLIINLIPVLNPLVRSDPSDSSVLYVSTTGNDSNTGLDTNHPLLTLRKAINKAKDGNNDIIYMRGGDYTQPGWTGKQGIRINRSGITIQNYNNEKVVIDGKSITLAAGYGIFMLYNGTTYYNNITIRGINISNSSYNGIVGGGTVMQANDDVIITGCSFYNITNRAINMWCDTSGSYLDDFRVDNSTFRKIQNNATKNECVTLVGCKDFIFENNSVSDWTKQFLCISGGCWGGKVRYNSFKNKWYYTIKLDPNTNHNRIVRNIDIYNNMFFGTRPASADNIIVEILIQPEQANGRVHNCSIYNNIFNRTSTGAARTFHCIEMYNNATVKGVKIEHINVTYNTIYVAEGTSSQCFKVVEGGMTITHCIFENNICINEGSSTNQVEFYDLVKAQTNVTIGHNCYYKTNGATLGVKYSDDESDFDTSLHEDPQLHNIAAGDFHLNSTSPAIDASDSNYTVSTDYDHYLRPQNGSYDIGAYEYVVPSITIEVPSTGEAIQDGVTFQSLITDPSGVNWVKYSIREPGGSQGTIIDSMYESLPASLTNDDTWELLFDTTQLPDGYYVLFVNASDNLGHENYSTMDFSIRNWAVLEMLPNTQNSKAGRTIPVKFSLKITAAVDPMQPFVRNEELTIIIYEKNHPETILQISTYGRNSTDYRINSTEEHYITNIKTLKTPKTYVAEIWRVPLLIGSIEFQTVK